jgi:hypothetical protein
MIYFLPYPVVNVNMYNLITWTVIIILAWIGLFLMIIAMQ